MKQIKNELKLNFNYNLYNLAVENDQKKIFWLSSKASIRLFDYFDKNHKNAIIMSPEMLKVLKSLPKLWCNWTNLITPGTSQLS